MLVQVYVDGRWRSVGRGSPVDCVEGVEDYRRMGFAELRILADNGDSCCLDCGRPLDDGRWCNYC